MTGRATTESHGRITVSVDGEDLGVFDTMSEPSSSAEIESRAPGGSNVRRAVYGGPREDEAVTVTREFVPERDHAVVRRLRPEIGFADATVREQPLDGRRLPFGTPSIYAGGLLQDVQTSGYDNDSASPRTISLVVAGGSWQ
jgi:hypothetical protein